MRNYGLLRFARNDGGLPAPDRRLAARLAVDIPPLVCFESRRAAAGLVLFARPPFQISRKGWMRRIDQ